MTDHYQCSYPSRSSDELQYLPLFKVSKAAAVLDDFHTNTEPNFSVIESDENHNEVEVKSEDISSVDFANEKVVGLKNEMMKRRSQKQGKL